MAGPGARCGAAQRPETQRWVMGGGWMDPRGIIPMVPQTQLRFPLTPLPGDPGGWMYPGGAKIIPPPRCCRAPRVSQSGRGRVCPHPSCGAE